MRVASVSEMKGNGKTQGPLPQEGGQVRQVYDLLKENAGYTIQFYGMTKKERTRLGVIFNYLTDFYGCDIRRTGKRGECAYSLVGEWEGDRYIDYAAQRFKDIK